MMMALLGRWPKLGAAALVMGLASCTSSGKFYTHEPDDEFSVLNTLAFPLVLVGADLVYESIMGAVQEGRGGAEATALLRCVGAFCHQAAAWDWDPDENQYHCRITHGLKGGEVTDAEQCQHQPLQDNWE
ncbi:hypothetical protein Fbal_1730 [Ferrimonas balearica DSM 9799]|uniref:Uncharacterized protein n=1 Tax=Ferrimonas balearica (strain DSM 9799 / CCM 4581 / KCTC 23876 / PAT) TaxID=550540 RepID=E1SRI3_FERBD|nr:hypothetical protein [Ferrimonas balearica]ADN75934.1 hypothetical protein Fbal_1730 [Ferrimonas balearica DSM 9799]